MTAQFDLVVIDAADIGAVGRFYAALTGWDVVREDADRFGVRAPDGQEVEFQRAPDHVSPRWPGQEFPQQFHLDIQTADPAAQVDRAIALGATHLSDGDDWITLADPAGHPFDLCQKDGVDGVMALFAVTIDAPNASALARFYAAVTGMDLTYDGPEGALLSGGGRNLMFQQVQTYTPPAWPDPSRPQQAHLDLKTDDLDAAEALAHSHGATTLDASSPTFRVLADPAGHPFCLVR
ncbi:VOC family protein [Actinokineospora soli]|uniref:VOC family protein n=1 Tax=Actinokineospora soli TaxID=1048753 RepID=A0ABW2TTL8_9PSEU